MKRLIVLGLAAMLLPALAVSAEPAEQALGGVYNRVVSPDEGEYAREGTITVIFDGQGKAWFKLNLGRKDGATAIFSPDDWIPAGNRQFDYNYNDGSVDYTMQILHRLGFRWDETSSHYVDMIFDMLASLRYFEG